MGLFDEFLALNDPVGMALKKEINKSAVETIIAEDALRQSPFWTDDPEVNYTTQDNVKVKVATARPHIDFDLRDFTGTPQELLNAIETFIPQAQKEGVSYSIKVSPQYQEMVDTLITKHLGTKVSPVQDAQASLAETFKELDKVREEQERLIKKQAEIALRMQEYQNAKAEAIKVASDKVYDAQIKQVVEQFAAAQPRIEAMREVRSQASPLYKQILERMQANTNTVLEIEKRWSEPLTFANFIPRVFQELRDVPVLGQAKKAVQAYSVMLAELDNAFARYETLYKRAEQPDIQGKIDELNARKEFDRATIDSKTIPPELAAEKIGVEKQAGLLSVRERQLESKATRRESEIIRLQAREDELARRAAAEADRAQSQKLIDEQRQTLIEQRKLNQQILEQTMKQEAAEDKLNRENAAKFGIKSVSELPSDFKVTNKYLREQKNNLLYTLITTGTLPIDFIKAPLNVQIDALQGLGSEKLERAANALDTIRNSPEYSKQLRFQQRRAKMEAGGQFDEKIFMDNFLAIERAAINTPDNVYALRADKISLPENSGMNQFLQLTLEKNKNATLWDLVKEIKEAGNLSAEARAQAAAIISTIAKQHVAEVNDRYQWMAFGIPRLTDYKVMDGAIPKDKLMNIDNVIDLTSAEQVKRFLVVKPLFSWMRKKDDE